MEYGGLNYAEELVQRGKIKQSGGVILRVNNRGDKKERSEKERKWGEGERAAACPVLVTSGSVIPARAVQPSMCYCPPRNKLADKLALPYPKVTSLMDGFKAKRYSLARFIAIKDRYLFNGYFYKLNHMPSFVPIIQIL